MFLYYENMDADCDAELIGEYDTIEQVMSKIKEECDNGHEECPEYIPSFDDYLSNDFSSYNSDYEYKLYVPTNEEVDMLDKNGHINIIYSFIDGDESVYVVTKYELQENYD